MFYTHTHTHTPKTPYKNKKGCKKTFRSDWYKIFLHRGDGITVNAYVKTHQIVCSKCRVLWIKYAQIYQLKSIILSNMPKYTSFNLLFYKAHLSGFLRIYSYATITNSTFQNIVPSQNETLSHEKLLPTLLIFQSLENTNTV
jgi:hypothetical protein